MGNDATKFNLLFLGCRGIGSPALPIILAEQLPTSGFRDAEQFAVVACTDEFHVLSMKQFQFAPVDAADCSLCKRFVHRWVLQRQRPPIISLVGSHIVPLIFKKFCPFLIGQSRRFAEAAASVATSIGPPSDGADRRAPHTAQQRL